MYKQDTKSNNVTLKMLNYFGKWLMICPYFIVYVFYVLLTMKERNEYLLAEMHQAKCVHSEDTSQFLTSEKTYYFDKSKKPERKYMTWEEFWSDKGY